MSYYNILYIVVFLSKKWKKITDFQLKDEIYIQATKIHIFCLLN